MIGILIRLATRNLIKRKGFAAINIGGMTISLMAFMLIMLYVRHERSFDDFHQDPDRIHRLYSIKGDRQLAITPYTWGHALQAEMPEVEACVNLQIITSLTVKYQDRIHAEGGIVVTDSTFFDVFDYPIVRGTRHSLLRSPNQVIITPETARKYFGEVDPLGKVLQINLWGTFIAYEVQGVVACPANSHIQFDFLVPNHQVKKHFFDPSAYESWRIHFVYSYLKMAPDFDRARMQENLLDFLPRHMKEDYGGIKIPVLEPLRDIYLHSALKLDFQPRGSAENNRILTLVALAILLMAAINFVNITTAQSLDRMKEVSLRKVLGAGRSSLWMQFMGEALFASLLAMLVALLLVMVALPYVRGLTDVSISWQELLQWSNVRWILGFTLAFGLVAGLYPSFLLSAFRPIEVLQTRRSGHARSATPRKVLVTLQFLVAVVLLVSTGVIHQQVSFMQQRDLGFSKDQSIALFDAGQVSGDEAKVARLRARLRQSPLVTDVAASSTYPGQPSFATKYLPEGFEHEEPVSLSTIYCDHDFLKAYDIPILQGRDFDRASVSDTAAVLVNEAAIRFFASRDSTWLSEPLGKTIGFNPGRAGTEEVIGVFRDYHHESLRNSIGPLILKIEREYFLCLQIQLVAGKESEGLQQVQQVWAELFPDIPFDYKYVDQEFAQLHKADRLLGMLMALLSLLAVVVAALGLFGLSSFLALEKSREMSIRKVMGANETQLVLLLTNLFLKLVLLAGLLALPLSYMLMDQWLATFAYRIAMPGFVYVLAMLYLLLITIVTIGYHAFRTATLDPVKVLSEE